MHYLLIALAPKDVDAIKHIEHNLADYVDLLQYYNGDWPTPDGHKGFTHDYWLVGGRWTGWLTGYKPFEDPANLEPCGKRFEGHPKDCASCKGTGFVTQWPFFYKHHDSDVGTVEQVLADKHVLLPIETDDAGSGRVFAIEHLPHALLTEDGVWIWRDDWMVEPAARIRAALEAKRDLQAVVVDCHR